MDDSRQSEPESVEGPTAVAQPATSANRLAPAQELLDPLVLTLTSTGVPDVVLCAGRSPFASGPRSVPVSRRTATA